MPGIAPVRDTIEFIRTLNSRSCGKALYLFAGEKRHSSIGSVLKTAGWEVVEVDILQGGKLHDLTLVKVQTLLLDRVKAREFDALLTSPPCDTYSRVKFSNDWGPRPTRTFDFPRGLANCTPIEKKRNQLANALVDFNFEVIEAHLSHSDTMLVLEFPEDLGAIQHGKWAGVRPASIFQAKAFFRIAALPGVCTGGVRQLDFGTPYVKPTRLILRFNGSWYLPELFVGLPAFDSGGKYLGPIPHSKGTVTLAKRSKEEAFRTTTTAAWPIKLCQALGKLLIAGLLERPAKRAKLSTADGLAAMDLVDTPGSRTTDSSEFPITQPPENFWVGGVGPPRMTKGFGRVTPFHDGCGLTSPGRWPRTHRRFPEGKRWEDLRAEIAGFIHKDLDETGVLKHIAALAVGVDIFNHQWVLDTRKTLHSWMGRQSGSYDSSGEPFMAPGQPFFLKLAFGLLCEVRDADCMLFQNLHEGVSIGVLSPLPHTPALYELQSKWRLLDDPFIQAKLEKINYSSVEPHVDVVEAQFREEQALGWMECLTDADFSSRFGPNRAVSALAVLVEPDKIRVLHDATHDTRVNHRIRCRDRQRMPTVREQQFLLNEQRASGTIAFALLADVSKAHRRVLVHPSEHGLLGCRLRPGEVWINKVGTFGVASASYWWSRVSSALFRLVFAIMGGQLSLDILLFADDSLMLANSRQERFSILVAIILLLALGLPLKWAKFRGGFQVAWVGFGVCYRTYSIGLTESRAKWVSDWTSKLVSEGMVDVAEMRSGVGRLSYAAQALFYERAFLGMLYLWTSAIVRASSNRVSIPWAIRLILSWIGKRMSQLNPCNGGRLQIAPDFDAPSQEWFRTDAKAEGGKAFIGGWQIMGNTPPSRAKWFAMQITVEEAPWVFVKQGDPQRVIAALELLATMVAMVLFDPEFLMGGRSSCALTSSTDNKGNTYIVNKLASTKWPITTLLIELSEQLRRRSAIMDLQWRQRDLNMEADALTNMELDGFDPLLRVGSTFSDIKWLVLPDIMETSVALYKEVQQQRERPKTHLAKSSHHRKPRGMKSTDPW